MVATGSAISTIKPTAEEKLSITQLPSFLVLLSTGGMLLCQLGKVILRNMACSLPLLGSMQHLPDLRRGAFEQRDRQLHSTCNLWVTSPADSYGLPWIT